MIPLLVIVGDFNIVGVSVLELETDTPLVVYRNGMLAGAFPSQRMKSVAGRHLEIVQTGGKVDIFKPPPGPPQQVGRQSL